MPKQQLRAKMFELLEQAQWEEQELVQQIEECEDDPRRAKLQRQLHKITQENYSELMEYLEAYNPAPGVAPRVKGKQLKKLKRQLDEQCEELVRLRYEG
jgi:hypothetical protein